MNVAHRLFQLRRLSRRNLPRVVARRLLSTGRAAKERLLYTPAGPRRKAPAREVRKIGLFHPDAFSSTFAERFRELYPDEAKSLLEAGRQGRDLVVDLLGSGPVDLKIFSQRQDLRLYPSSGGKKAEILASGGLVPWHFDVKSGVGWPADRFFSEIEWGAPGVDVKVPWELSRCQHFLPMAQAYALTGDESFAKSFSDQLEDWIRRNPPKYGVNWACAMDVALRACNWLAAWEFFERSPLVSEFVRTRLPGALWEHGRHIADHLEWSGELSTNHYLSDLLGLAFIGRAVGESGWVDFSVREMAAEIQSQIRDDGFDHEASTAYQRLVMELFFYFSLAISPACGESRLAAVRDFAGDPFADRLRRMAEALSGLMDARGRVPLIGDNDSGRTHVLLNRADNDMAYIVDLYALLLDDPSLRPAGSKAAAESAWLFGVDAARRLSSAGSAEPRAMNPGPSGLASLRGPSDILVFAAQPNGTRGVGNHTHNDKLSFCLTIGVDIFLTDPGTLVYTADPRERNAFRSTAAHTTMKVGDHEQNRIPARSMFSLGDDAHPAITQFKPGVRLAGEHDGYARLDNPVIHRRSIERIDAPLRWIIEDEADGRGEQHLRWSFIAGPDIAVSAGPDGTVRLTGAEGELELKAHPDLLEFRIESGRVAPAYGVARPAPVITVEWRGTLPFRATFTALWRPSGRA